MQKLLLTVIISIACLLPSRLLAQQKLNVASTDCSISGSCVFVAISGPSGAATISIPTNASGNTITFEATADPVNGTTAPVWFSITSTQNSASATTQASSTASTGWWQFNVGAFTQIRARMSTLVSGTTTVNINQSTASARAGGGGGNSSVTATGAPITRTLAATQADTFNVKDNGALGTNAATAIGTTYGTSLAAFAAFTTAAGATPFSWATNPLYGLTFSIAVSANQATVATPLTFTETLSDGTWSATVALWQDPNNGNYLLQPGMLVTGSCIAANTTVSSVDRTAGDAGYGQVTLSQNTSSTCASTTVITFTISPAQLQALTQDWLGIQTAVARADAANNGIGSQVDIPAGQYILNHPVMNATGVTQGIKFVGGGQTSTVITMSSDLGADSCVIKESVRNSGSSASEYRDFALAAPSVSLVMGTSPNGMDGLCVGSNSKTDGLVAQYFHAGFNGIGQHWFLRTATLSNNGYGVYFGPYDSAGGVGNQVISDSQIVGNTIASIATSTTDTMDSVTFSAVHTGFGPYGFYQEIKPSTVTTPRSFLTNSVLTNVFIESVGNAWLYGPNDFYGIVDNNQFIGGGFSDVGGHAQYKIVANPVPGVVDVAVFNNNQMIGTNWSAFGNVSTAVVDIDGACNNNNWINDENFILGGTSAIPALSCGQGPTPSMFSGGLGSGTFLATFSSLSSAFLPLTDLGGGTAQAYATGTPFAGIAAAPASAFTYVPVFTSSPFVAAAVKKTTAEVMTQGQFLYPAVGGVTAIPNGMGAIGTAFGASSGVTTTVGVKLDSIVGAANGASVFGASETGSIASACETAAAPTTLATGAATTTTGLSCLPANSIIDAVTARVTTTITGACTGWELGDGTTAARFSTNNTGLAAGTVTDAAHIGTFNNTGIASATTGVWQAAAHAVVVTCAGGNAGAGAIRVIVYYHSPTAPTS